MSKQLRGAFLLLLTAMIWGVAFVAQTKGMDYLQPFSFQAARQFLGFLMLSLFIAIRDRQKPARRATEADRKKLLTGGVLCGVALFTATISQQFGLLDTTAGRSGFITALYILIVPLIGLLFGRRVQLRVWCAVALAIVGMYFLCFSGTFSFGKGELLTLVCSFCFAAHILLVAKFGGSVDGIRLSRLQFLVSSLLSAVCMLLFEHPTLSGLLAGWMPLCYSGCISCAVGYTLQIVAQKDVNPTLAAILMSMESVFSATAGWILLGQRMSLRELGGCALMLLAIVLAQLPKRESKPKLA